jgi:beta-lactamase regulating signal transducer with metallopeptidase domain
MTFALLVESAIRSLLLGAGVWTILKLVRLRDSGSETVIWTTVLIAALLMPQLTQALPIGIRMHVPSLFTATRQTPVLVISLLPANPNAVPQADIATALWTWLAAHSHILVWGTYLLVVGVGVSRLIIGLVFTIRLYQCAVPIDQVWATGWRIRASTKLTGPVSFGPFILLPADYNDWSQLKLAAVLAHEQSHVGRGDFFIQLLACLHRIFFWFSPFAWWLQAHLCALAETASDEAAVRLINDRATYAEILIEVSRKAQGIPALVAMAKGPNVYLRLDHILEDAPPERCLGKRTRILAAAAIISAAGILASANAEVPPASLSHTFLVSEPSNIHQPREIAARTVMSNNQVTPANTRLPMALIVSQATLRQIPAPPVSTAQENQAAPERQEHAIDSQVGAPRNIASAAAKQDNSDFTYNPRALLDGPSTVLLPAIIPVKRDEHGTPGTSVPAVILNLNSPTGADN